MTTKRNQPCPCGSGKRYKNCCAVRQNNLPASASKKELACSLVDQGNVMLGEEKHEEALKLYQEALAMYPEYARAHYNIGVVLKLLGQMEKAAASYEKALLIEPEDIEALNNLGVILRGLGRLEEAAAKYRMALAIKPENAETHNNLGVLLRKLGRIEEAAASYEQALAIRPEYAEVSNNKGVILNAQGRIEEAISCFKKALALRPDFPQAQTHLAIIAWVNGDWDECRNYLDHISNSTEKLSGEDIKFVSPYFNFLDRLLTYRGLNPARYVKDKNLPIIYVVGDSHCLSTANTKINFKGAKYLAEAKIVIGCKAWHLANKNNNIFKYEFEKRIESTPAGATAILMFGEIDCRLEEGIIKHFKKNNVNLAESIIALVNDYFEYILRIVNHRNIFPIICNVPARFIEQGLVSDTDKKLLDEVLAKFNQALEDNAVKRQLTLLDVYTFSKINGGETNNGCHIDNNHLRPSVFQYLIKDL
jgi:Tfp pilus assembly protein PilF